MPFYGIDTVTGLRYRCDVTDGVYSLTPVTGSIPTEMPAMPIYETDTVTGDNYRLDIIDGVLALTPLLGPIPGAHGYTPVEIIELANKRTERRGETQLDLPRELVMVTQELCAERRWHWRKRSVAVTTEAGLSTYDLAAQSGMSGLTCERVCREGPKIILGPQNFVKLSAIFETDDQEMAREDDSTGQPGRYFIDGQDQLRLVTTPNDAYRVRVPMWVLPDSSLFGVTIPLVPAYLHHLLLKALEARIFRFALGEGNAKYLATQAEYEKGVMRAGMSTEFADGRIKEWKSNDEAVQSS